MTKGRSHILSIRRELVRLGDRTKAKQMQAYMKSTMPYHGVSAPLLKKTIKRLFAACAWSSGNEWQSDVLALWRGAKFREERYSALHLAGHKNAIEFQTPKTLPLYEELIVTGAWWDYVDDVAIHRVGPILADYPKIMCKKMLMWSRSKDIWKRRTSIICQIMLKDKIDLDLLFACIEPSLGEKEFFLRKGIGWALRQVAWTDPETIIDYVKTHQDQLSPLSQREALKNISKIKSSKK